MSEEEDIRQSGRSIKRKYTSINKMRSGVVEGELRKEIKRLKSHVDELESRLIVFIKAFNLHQDTEREVKEHRSDSLLFFEKEREEIRLLKYALNDINVEKKDS